MEILHKLILPFPLMLIFFSTPCSYGATTQSVPESIVNGTAVMALDYIFSQIEAMIKPGISTEQLEQRVAYLLEKVKARGYFKGYGKYPNYICASINEQVVHTPPSKRRIQNGDLLKVEFGLEKGGQYAFLAWTYPVGNISAQNKRLIECGKKSLGAATSKALPMTNVADLTRTIDTTIRSAGFKPNRDYVGYRMGERPVMPPQIPMDFDPRKPPTGILMKGDTISLLVIVHSGEPDLLISSDGWTVFSSDHRPSVIFSRMLHVEPNMAHQLTKDRL